MKLTAEMLTGKSRAHLQPLPCPLSPNHFLQAETVHAFKALQQAAYQAGFNLQPASSFRDFQRQQLIWNGKFSGERKVHDDQGNTLDLNVLDDWARSQAILRWSALPGASRHHWGTEIDIFDPDLLPPNQSLQLEPWEYDTGGYFTRLSEFLLENLPRFDFNLPFMNLPDHKKIGREPWHISYLPLAEQARETFSPDILLASWQGEEIAGVACLQKNLDKIWSSYMI